MTKSDLARQILTLFQNEGLVTSFELKNDSIDIQIDGKIICLNMDRPISEEPDMFRNVVVSPILLNEETSEIYRKMSLDFYPEMVQDTRVLHLEEDYYLMGKLFSESVIKVLHERKND
jgi:hypothetical protein